MVSASPQLWLSADFISSLPRITEKLHHPISEWLNESLLEKLYLKCRVKIQINLPEDDILQNYRLTDFYLN